MRQPPAPPGPTAATTTTTPSADTTAGARATAPPPPAPGWPRTLGRWMPTFLGFPAGGLASSLLLGPVDRPIAALAGGALSGAILGLVQSVGWRRGGGPGRGPWALATAGGFALGLAAGAATVGYATGPGPLAAQGAITGLAVGAAQAVVLHRRLGRLSALWPLLLAGLWALGWTITSAAGIDVERRYTVFGSSGAIVVTAVTAVLPLALQRAIRRTGGR